MLTTVIGANLLRTFFVGQILDRVRNVTVFIAIGLAIPVITPTLALLYMGLFGIVPWALYENGCRSNSSIDFDLTKF